MKKIIAYFVIFTMVLSMLPLNAFASDVSGFTQFISVDLNKPNGVAVDSSGNIYVSDTESYSIQKMAAISAIDMVAADKAALTIGYAVGDSASSVTSDLTLTVTGAVYGSDITWSSDNTAVISNSGVVTRPSYESGDAAVTVSAAIYNAGESATKDFNLTVLKLAEADPLESDFTFDVDTGTITGYTGEGGVVEIPSTIGGVPVTVVGDNAFSGNNTITGVIIPAGVLSIGTSAFDGCYNIESVTLPDGLTSIGRCAFYWCSKLKSITLPDSLTSAGSGMFMGCFKLESVNIPIGITELPVSIFSYCESLKSVTIPDNIVSIGGGAFQNCKSLRTVKLPANLTSVGDDAFCYCQQLAQAVFTGNAPTSFGSNVFNDVKDGFRIFYSSDSTGFSSPTWNGYASEQYNPAATYTLTYDANGGTTDFTSVDSLHTGDYVIIPNNNDSLVKDGHNFSGWNTSADGTGTAYTEGNVVPIGVLNVTLYAQWIKRYSISIDTLEHGKITVDKTSATEGEVFTVTITPDEGWNYIPGTLKFIDPVTGGDIGGEEPPPPGGDRSGKYFMAASDKPTKPPIPDSDIVGDYFMPASDILVTAEFAEGDFLYETITGSGIKTTKYIGQGGNVVIPSSIDGKSVTTIGSCTIFYTDMAITSVTIPSTVTTIEEDAISYCPALKSVVFEGNAPTIDDSNFEMCNPDFTIYYYEGSTGFTSPTWKGYPSVAIPRPIYTVTFNKNGGDTEASPITKTAVSGGNVGTLPTPPTRSGYNFSGWNTAANGSGTAFTAATAVNANITVYAQWTAIPSSHDNDHTSNTHTNTTTTTTTPTIPAATTTTTTTGTTTQTVTSTTTTTATTGANGSAAAAVTLSQVTDAVNKAVAAAAEAGAGTAANVEIKVTAPTDTKSVATSIPKAAMDTVANSTAGLTVTTPIAAITFDGNALDTISGVAAGDVKITASTVEAATLPAETQQVVGDRPVYNFSVTSGDKTISQFGGNVTVSVPYTPKAGENTNAIVIYYINAEGKPEIVSNCAYDPATGTIKFTTNHFSTYAVGYNKVTFKDVPADAAYSKAVSFIAAREITTGTGDGKFSPEAAMTRGQFIVMVMKAYGIKPDAAAKDNFADAGNTYYTNYLSAAKRLGLATGIGNNLYAPDKEITQQEMISLLYKTLKVIGELPKAEKGKELTAYKDASQIAPWAKEAMTLFVKVGITTGTDSKLQPSEKANRAQMAQVLYNLMTK